MQRNARKSDMKNFVVLTKALGAYTFQQNPHHRMYSESTGSFGELDQGTGGQSLDLQKHHHAPLAMPKQNLAAHL